MATISPVQRIPMEGGGQIALRRLSQGSERAWPVVVTHGTISSIEAVRQLGEHLADSGFDCWLLEWGGHGDSVASSREQNFEYPAHHDVPTAIEEVLDATQRRKLFWVSHSGGGHLVLMHLARRPELQGQVAGIVTMGAQATDAAMRPLDRLKTRLLWALTMLLAKTPKLVLPRGSDEEPTRLLAQWATWNLAGRWTGTDGFDYERGLSRVHVPVLMVAGGRDTIAPASGCRRLFDAIGSRDKTWLLCAVSEGFSKDFSHGQLVRGRAARDEVFPHIGDWLRARDRGREAVCAQ